MPACEWWKPQRRRGSGVEGSKARKKLYKVVFSVYECECVFFIHLILFTIRKELFVLFEVKLKILVRLVNALHSTKKLNDKHII